MFSLEHIIFLICLFVFIVLLHFGAHFLKKQNHKDLFLLFWAFLCLFLHVSTMYTTLMNNDGFSGNCYNNQLFPIYFCNYIMYLVLAVSLWWNKNSRFFKSMATFTAYGGVIGATLSILVRPPVFGVWSITQSALSHSCLLIACLWLFVGGYVKINVFNLAPFSLGLMSCGVVGGVVELIYFLCGQESPNAMYLINGPEELPAFKWWMFVICMLVAIFAFTSLWEYFTRKKEDRWYCNYKDIYIYFPEHKRRPKDVDAVKLAVKMKNL